MEEEKRSVRHGAGRFLPCRERRRPVSRWLTILVLMAWDGLLMYMIVDCLIDAVYGAAFVAVVSVYLGYQI